MGRALTALKANFLMDPLPVFSAQSTVKPATQAQPAAFVWLNMESLMEPVQHALTVSIPMVLSSVSDAPTTARPAALLILAAYVWLVTNPIKVAV